jgi:hypothetical protein
MRRIRYAVAVSLDVSAPKGEAIDHPDSRSTGMYRSSHHPDRLTIIQDGQRQRGV